FASNSAFSSEVCSSAVGSTMTRMFRMRFIFVPSVADVAVVTHARAVAYRPMHSREIIRQTLHLVRTETVEKQNEIRLDVETMSMRELAHLAEQVRVVLIAKRRNEPIVIASTVFRMAGRAPLPVRGLAERQPFAGAGLRFRQRLHAVQIGGQIGPFLRLAHFLLREDRMHFGRRAFELREISELLDQVGATLPGKGGNQLVGIA